MLLFLLILCLPTALAVEASGGGYQVSEFTNGLQGGEASGSGYNGRFLTTTTTGSAASGGSYEGTVGFFGAEAAAEEETTEETSSSSSSSDNGGSGTYRPPTVITSTPKSFTLTTLTTHRVLVNGEEIVVRIQSQTDDTVTLSFSGTTATLEAGTGGFVEEVGVYAYVTSVYQGATVFSLSTGERKPFTFEFDVPIQTITVYAVQEPVITVTERDDPPATLEDAYAYFEILADTEIEQAIITFRVPHEQAMLFRYGTAWNTLETTKLYADSEYTYFSATTPGFSWYAIQVIEMNVTPQNISADGTVEGVREQPVVVKHETKFKGWVLIVAGLAVLALLAWLYKAYLDPQK
ncbi:MAG: PGF-pre-PGF domain-containing protein [Candidatus Woesearchaeota archaeon]|nr:PGF-pre-PGF domain-containing protein [Candidatus Woesearchaeota archaeon]